VEHTDRLQDRVEALVYFAECLENGREHRTSDDEDILVAGRRSRHRNAIGTGKDGVHEARVDCGSHSDRQVNK
jgi:hypothetical protein